MVNFIKILQYKTVELTVKDIKERAKNYFYQFDTTFAIHLKVEETTIFQDLPVIDTSCLDEIRTAPSYKKQNTKEYTKPIFQKLSKEVHPDSGGFHSGELFLEIKQAYDYDKIGPLLFFALSFGIDIEWNEKIESLLDQEIVALTNEMNRIKETVGWVWGEASSDKRKDIENLVRTVINP